MQNSQTFIQMRVSSNELLTDELINILNARTVDELREAIQNNALFWISVFRVFVKSDFSYLREVVHKHSNSTYQYVTLKYALELLINFDSESNAYGSRSRQLVKFKQLLSALSFLDSSLYSSFVLRKFKYGIVNEFIEELNGNTRHTESD